ncbi:hypothetical protein RFI36_09660 [Acinetobacter gerneri]|jgi:hypothetical protein|uniref:Uncharacterized protein n=1 Tax=Acinetobacter gerneri TaxID=202952 RepID=A0AAW8JJE2_9GAMM|nr:hypothetical protein [Acinetobacter gerneri]MCH4246148.1 hypothetical protein [Acinetobacter gerneri]MDQ9009899.1 hypothetical protein [Acinetobacter gerneri]MDQ9014181.1 hypothetical protein [Acinetobacter gerneri]MDQ9025177.1 hypothetical protein [Acinetobacter gerneri]MDQ9050720.1 hypothetical protein [Acinetobacter gerneri]
MAFDLVQYFAEQIKIQKPQLLNQLDPEDRKSNLLEINALTLAKLVSLWKKDDNRLYQEISQPDELYVQEIARHLTTSKHNQSPLNKPDLEQSISEVLNLQIHELKQLDQTGNFGKEGLKELILGQIEHLSGQADDWVWTTSDLTELHGSKPIHQEEISLDETMKEFNQMVNTQNAAHDDVHATVEVAPQKNPTWAKVAEPLVALVVLWVLFDALMKYVFH